jgi:hypothetical protein
MQGINVRDLFQIRNVSMVVQYNGLDDTLNSSVTKEPSMAQLWENI